MLSRAVAALLLTSLPLAAQVFTHPPTFKENVAGVIPLGHLNPGGGHVLPTDHMYLLYPFPETGEDHSYPVFAMAAGELVMVTRTRFDATSSGFDYGIFIRHSRTLTSYFIHLHKLADPLPLHLESTGSGWITVRPGFEVMLLGQFGAPVPAALTAGQFVGETASFSHAWDVGVVDARVPVDFVARGPLRYPEITDYMRALGLRGRAPYGGQESINAACFLDYLTPALQTEWFPLLTSDPRGCGTNGWDVFGTIRGNWFNPALAAEPDGIFRIEEGAFSISPDHARPSTHVQIAIASGGSLAALDPTEALPQLRNAFVIAVDRTPGTRVNPDPATIGMAEGPVCYDLSYNDGGVTRHNTLHLRLSRPRTLLLHLDSTARDVPSCAALSVPPEGPGSAWVRYER